ncbi:MAG: glutamine--fructose-6-phosphate transaminase (isomerizing) [Oligoflexia bacterium]|nr:glutamine--fructose-6-phosphate transaminase (isomerizing) [Oligoflexia bacterium]
MCGIFAYSGSRKVTEVLIHGLKNLEYRGYDSAGIAFFDKDVIHRFRVCGGVKELQNKTQSLSNKGGLGMGHTRWATHGSPSETNAHPHHSGSIYVVHNGVIENVTEIKQMISTDKLLSETDTELIAHLINHFHQSENLSFLESVLKSVPLLRGSYAVAAMHEKTPGEIVAFKSGPPLILAKKENEFFISSDLHALENDVEALFLEEEEILHLKASQFQIFNFKGEKINRSFQKISKGNFLTLNNPKGKHPHFMIKEILEQPIVLSQLITDHINKSSQEIDFKMSRGNQEELKRVLKNSSEILILACGSSYYAGLFAKYFLEDIAKVRVSVEIASEFIYKRPLVFQNTLAVFISQSGETADILTALKQTEQLGLKSLCFCNVQNSSLERKTNFSISLSAGKEIAVASTKTFFASVFSLSLFAFFIAKIKGQLQEEKKIIAELLPLPSLIEKVLNCDQFFLEIMEKLKSFKTFLYLGRGLYYPMALEGALKLKEIAYLHAEAYPSGEMKHGPLAMIDKNTAVVALQPAGGILYQKSLTNLREALSRGAYLISIGGKPEDKELKNLSDSFLSLPTIHNLIHPILSIIPLQMMAYYISRNYGYNVDQPRNLAKSVTVE